MFPTIDSNCPSARCGSKPEPPPPGRPPPLVPVLAPPGSGDCEQARCLNESDRGTLQEARPRSWEWPRGDARVADVAVRKGPQTARIGCAGATPCGADARRSQSLNGLTLALHDKEGLDADEGGCTPDTQMVPRGCHAVFQSCIGIRYCCDVRCGFIGRFGLYIDTYPQSSGFRSAFRRRRRWIARPWRRRQVWSGHPISAIDCANGDRGQVSCGREDSNFHGVTPTSTSSLRVYHSATTARAGGGV